MDIKNVATEIMETFDEHRDGLHMSVFFNGERWSSHVVYDDLKFEYTKGTWQKDDGEYICDDAIKIICTSDIHDFDHGVPDWLIEIADKYGLTVRETDAWCWSLN